MAALKIGSKLQTGKYEITKVLGSGNFGITYLASTKIPVKGQLGQMDVTINVAVKEFFMKDLNNRTSDETTVEGSRNTMVSNYRQKFRKEAENLAKLHHPNIVKVIEVFDENNTTYYVMEYIAGGSLDEYIKQKGHLPEKEALAYTIEIGGALSYMHKNRMVHLDLKPKNMMRNQNGNLFLIDFGLSKQYDDNGEPESSTSIGLGTPGYAPLEQANYKQDGNLPVTLDVYALGASLYKMLTGKTPPDSSTILNEGLPLSLLKQAGVSEGTISVVEKAMSPIRKERYQTVAAMSAAISDLLDDNEQTRFLTEEKEKEEETSYLKEPGEKSVEHEPIVENHEPIVEEAHQAEQDDRVVANSNDVKEKNNGGVMKYLAIAGVAFIVLFFLFKGFNKSVAPEDNVMYQAQEELSFEVQEVDLGLPSGTIWSGWNVGANSAEEKGDLFAWGEAVSKERFSTDNYFDLTYSKFNLNSNTPSLIRTNHDTARQLWTSEWAMPSKQQVDELINNCEWTWGSYKGCKGMIGKGPNGHHIFFPTTGYGNENGIWYANSEGDYWCGELCNPNKHDHSNYAPGVIGEAKNSFRAYQFGFSSGGSISSGCAQRYYGRAVRPVKIR